MDSIEKDAVVTWTLRSAEQLRPEQRAAQEHRFHIFSETVLTVSVLPNFTVL